MLALKNVGRSSQMLQKASGGYVVLKTFSEALRGSRKPPGAMMSTKRAQKPSKAILSDSVANTSPRRLGEARRTEKGAEKLEAVGGCAPVGGTPLILDNSHQTVPHKKLQG